MLHFDIFWKNKFYQGSLVKHLAVISFPLIDALLPITCQTRCLFTANRDFPEQGGPAAPSNLPEI